MQNKVLFRKGPPPLCPAKDGLFERLSLSVLKERVRWG